MTRALDQAIWLTREQEAQEVHPVLDEGIFHIGVQNLQAEKVTDANFSGHLLSPSQLHPMGIPNCRVGREASLNVSQDVGAGLHALTIFAVLSSKGLQRPCC